MTLIARAMGQGNVQKARRDWIARAMAQALDKYENSFSAAGERGDRLDSKI